MRPIEIETLAELDARVRGREEIRAWHLQSLDLTDRAGLLGRLDVSRTLFLGCRFAPGSEEDVRRRGGLVFPTVPEVPFNPYRGALYSPTELYAGIEAGYDLTPDAVVYAWTRTERALQKTLSQALHDHSIDDALQEYVAGRALVGVMGGHASGRGTPAYLDAAMLGHQLSAEFTVATGGGPGSMEAANLGAWLAAEDSCVIEEAAGLLAAVPSYAPDVSAWAQAAFDVRERWPGGTESLGVPTWFYGHEPPNAFATSHAKYFRNAIRESVLLENCRRGIVFLPGAAGTVQEIFQDACENYYAEPEQVAPMVLVGKDYWTRQLPVWELLQVLAGDRALSARVHLVDRPEEVLPLLLEVGGRSREARA